VLNYVIPTASLCLLEVIDYSFSVMTKRFCTLEIAFTSFTIPHPHWFASVALKKIQACVINDLFK